MNFKSLFMFGFTVSLALAGNAFASDPVTQIILSEVVTSGRDIQKVIDKLTLKIKSMKDENGGPIDPGKISSLSCFFDNEVFVYYHSKYGKDFTPNFCRTNNLGGGLPQLNPSDAFGGF